MAQIYGYNDCLIPPNGITFPNCELNIIGDVSEDNTDANIYWLVIEITQNGTLLDTFTSNKSLPSNSPYSYSFSLDSSLGTSGSLIIEIEIHSNIGGHDTALDRTIWEFEYSNNSGSNITSFMELNGKYVQGTLYINDNGVFKEIINAYEMNR